MGQSRNEPRRAATALAALIGLAVSASARQFVDDPARPLEPERSPSELASAERVRKGLAGSPGRGPILGQAWVERPRIHGLGIALALGPDLTGDCEGELFVSAAGTRGRCDVEQVQGRWRGVVTTRQGFVFAIDPRTGSIARAWKGAAPFDEFGARLCWVGDVDGDRQGEIAITSLRGGEERGTVEVFGSRDGRLIRRFVGEGVGDEFGAALARLPDLDADGVADLAIGAPRARGQGERSGCVRVFSLGSGAELARFDGPLGECRFGHALHAGADFTGDEVPELLIGAPEFDGGEISSAERRRVGLVLVYSLADGSIVDALVGGHSSQGLGVAVGSLRFEPMPAPPRLLVVSAASEPDNRMCGLLQAFAGPPFRVASEFASSRCYGTIDTSFGACLAVLPDLDGGGVEEIVVGAPDFGVWNGPSGALFFHAIDDQGDDRVRYGSESRAESHVDRYGTALARLPDLDGDGLDDYAVGAPGEGFETYSSVEITSSARGTVLREIRSDRLPMD